jgi:hypothetical protein
LGPLAWLYIPLGILAFIAVAGFPLYRTYKTRGAAAADDDRVGRAYLKAEAEANAAQQANSDRERTGTTPAVPEQHDGQSPPPPPASRLANRDMYRLVPRAFGCH